jgi:hypothetical protein
MPIETIKVFEDQQEAGDWRVECFDDDGACYVTIFGGPGAELRARDYADAVKSGVLAVVTAGPAAQ